MSGSLTQLVVFIFITALIGLLTYIKCRGHGHSKANENKEYFLAGGGTNMDIRRGLNNVN